MQPTYDEFLYQKSQIGESGGFEPLWLPDFLFPFQRFLVDWAVRRGRGALFADCGLGKTNLQLVWAENIIRHTNRPVLILTPLAVSHQFIREADKFGIEARRSPDGKPQPNVTVTNYERLHLFNPEDFSGVACDECFPAGTSVDTPSGSKDIETFRVGDKINNASGVDVVNAIHKREVPYAVAFTAGKRVTVSPNHPVFTGRGWVCAQDLEPGDCVLQTDAAVRMVQNTVPSSAVSGVGSSSFLREILFSEMADESTATSGEGSQPDGSSEAWAGEVAVSREWFRKGSGGNRESSQIEPDGRPGSSGTRQSNSEGHELHTFRAWRKRQGNDNPAVDFDGCLRKWVGERVEYIVGFQGSRLSNVLQTRLRERRSESRYRGGWELPPSSVACETGHQEGCEVGFVRVDSLEILEQGHPELERLRSPDGKLYFYDLEATRHPSFSVYGLLVHNSSILKHWTGATQKAVTRFLSKVPYRLLSTATPAPNDYIEMGTLSEAIGGLTHSDMLGTFFRQLSDDDKKKRATSSDIIHSKRLSWRVIQSMGQWALKAHAFEPFWKWVASWARACRKPSDLGDFDDAGFILPPLVRNDHVVEARNPPPGYLFNPTAFGLNQERAERRRTINERSELVAELVKKHDRSVIWCQLNDEADRLECDIPNAVQVKGSQSDDEKEERLLAFLDGDAQAQRLITKAKIAGLGLNLQHCAHMVTFVTHSYESFRQCIGRCHRFGQKRSVTLDVIATDGEANVQRSLDRKEKLAATMFDSVVRYMNTAANLKLDRSTPNPQVPTWLKK